MLCFPPTPQTINRKPFSIKTPSSVNMDAVSNDTKFGPHVGSSMGIDFLTTMLIIVMACMVSTNSLMTSLVNSSSSRSRSCAVVILVSTAILKSEANDSNSGDAKTGRRKISDSGNRSFEKTTSCRITRRYHSRVSKVNVETLKHGLCGRQRISRKQPQLKHGEFNCAHRTSALKLHGRGRSCSPESAFHFISRQSRGLQYTV